MASILTVITAGTQEITTRDNVKTLLKITATTEDDLIDLWIAQATSAIAKHCNRVFIEETVSEVFRRPVGRKLILARYPVTAMTSVTIDTVAQTAGTDFEYEAATGLMTKLSNDTPVFWGGLKTTVVYTGGYAIADVPADLERAAVLQISAYRSAVDRDPALKSESFVQRLYEYELFAPGTVLVPEVVDLLADYSDSLFG